MLLLIHSAFTSIATGCFVVGPDPDLSAFFDYITLVFMMWEEGAGGAVVAAAVLRGLCVWMSGMMCTPSSSGGSSATNDMIKRDRSHRMKIAGICSQYVMVSWVKIRGKLMMHQKQDGADMFQDCLRSLLDDVKFFVCQCCQWTCDLSQFHSENGPMGVINSWISSCSSSPCNGAGIVAQASPAQHTATSFNQSTHARILSHYFLQLKECNSLLLRL